MITTSPITDLTTAQEFIKSCVTHIGLGFHPDNDMEDYAVWGKDQSAVMNMFSKDTAAKLNDLNDSAHEQFRLAKACIYGFTIDLYTELEGKMSDPMYGTPETRARVYNVFDEDNKMIFENISKHDLVTFFQTLMFYEALDEAAEVELKEVKLDTVIEQMIKDGYRITHSGRQVN